MISILNEMERSFPTFTIITVTWNAASTLPATLASTGAQTCRDFEHLIMDGASTDGTQDLVEKYREENPDVCITLRSEPDKGLYDAMNKGIQLARGKYLVFLNAGDRFHSSETLAKVAAQGTEAGVLYGETDLVDAAGNFVRHRRLQTPEQLSWRKFREGMLVCHQSFYVQRELALPYNLSYKYSADFDWCIRMMQQAEQRGLPLVNTHLVLTDYLAEGMTTANHRASLLERLHIMAHHYGWLTAIGMHVWFVVRALLKK